MGSEHYCLRWNNHQSNLLGVFSQLLQDESLVDVTLACSEGASIRAHKVVLSACSSYFQSLFLDHPEKHPIVILKDVRLAELQTLVEFMYKGEVNVQYCQLSALLKTAESLKVKGLAEMTNQNTTLREPEREPDRLRPHSQTSKPACDSPVDAILGHQQQGPSTSAASTSASASASSGVEPPKSATSTAGAAIAQSSATSTLAAQTPPSSSQQTTHKREASDPQCSPPPSKRHHQHHHHNPSSSMPMSDPEDSQQPLDLYQRRPTVAASAASAAPHASTSGSSSGTGANASASTASSTSATSSSRQFPERTGDDTGGSHDNNGGGGGGGGKSSPARLPAADSPPPSGHTHNNNGDGDHREQLADLSLDRSEGCCAGGSGSAAAAAAVAKAEEDDFDDEMDLDEEEECGDNSSSNDVRHMGLNMKVACGSSVISHPMVGITSPLGITNSGIGGGGAGSSLLVPADSESARSTPQATTSSTSCLPSDLTQRPASRNSRDGTERPSSSGLVVCGPPSTSTGGSLSGGMSPTSTAAMAAAAAAAAAEALGPVQSVPLSLKKEIDLSEDDNSNSHSRSHGLPRSASAGGDLDYRGPLLHESETSELSPHGVASSLVGAAVGGGGGNSILGATCTSSSSSSNVVEQQQQQQQQQQNQHTHTHTHTSSHRPQTPPPMYPCVYCGAPFPTQTKLTRHILSHSLKTLEYRETATTQALLHQHLMQPELSMSSITHQLYQMNALVASSGADPQEQAALAIAFEKDFAAFASAIPGLDLEALAAASTSSSRGRDGGGSSSGNGGLGGSSGLLLSGVGGGPGSSSSASSSAAAAAAAAAAAVAASSSPSSSSSSAALLAATSDPNGGVLCKFCGKSFPDVASLITHLPVHTGDRPFKCEFCGKAFKLRHHMKDHCRVHTGERPFRCSMCGKTFSRSTILKAHEKTHFPKYVRKFLSPSPVDTKDELPQ